jgi:MurNAc alpha-1-phosphate uridylyltransferase
MKAMLLAAGLDERMRPLNTHTPTSLLPLGGRTLLDHALDRLRDAGATTVVVNTHWQAERIATHLAARGGEPRLLVRRESALLGTGGSIRAALDVLGPEPFFVVNGDAFWLDGPVPTFARIVAAWKEISEMAEADAVLLVHRGFQVHGETGQGDFALDPWGLVRRPKEREIVPYVYAGIQMIRPALLASAGLPEGPFDMNLAWDNAIAAGRVRAVVHDGLWFHLSTPSDLAEAEYNLHARALGEAR